MKFNKLKIAKLFICVMSFSLLAACGSAADSGDEARQERMTREERTSERDSDDDDLKDNDNKKDKKESDEEKEKPSSENGCEPIAYTLGYDWYSNASDDYEEIYADAKVAGIVIMSDGYDELKKSIQKENDKLYDDYISFCDEIDGMVSSGDIDESYYMPWSQESEIFVGRADSQIFSYHVMDYSYTGGAHGYSGFMGKTFDSQTGKELKINDVITDMSGLQEFIISYLKSVEYDYALFDFTEDEGTSQWEDTVNSYFKNNPEYINWWISGNTLEICFNAYEIAPYASGAIYVDIDVNACGFFNEKYIPKVDYCSMLTYNEFGDNYVCNIDVNNDGDIDQISIETEGIFDENDYLQNQDITIYLNDSSVKFDYALEYKGAYVMQAPNGKYYLYLQTGHENDWVAVSIYDINDPEKGIQFIETSEVGAFYNYTPINPQAFLVEDRVDSFGTHGVYTQCHIEDDGYIVADNEDYYYLMAYDTDKVFSKRKSADTTWAFGVLQSFEAQKIDSIENMKVIDSVIIEEGEELLPYVTYWNNDYYNVGDIYMIFKRKNGDLIKVQYDDLDEESWERTVNGILETELFSGLYYAG